MEDEKMAATLGQCCVFVCVTQPFAFCSTVKGRMDDGTICRRRERREDEKKCKCKYKIFNYYINL